MKEANVKHLLRMLGADVAEYQNREGWVISSCPFAPWTHSGGTDSNPSFGVKMEVGRQKYHCFSCPSHGKLVDMPVDMMEHQLNDPVAGMGKDIAEAIAFVGDDDYVEVEVADYDEIHDKGATEDVVFPEDWLETFKTVDQCQPALDYLATREIDSKVWRQLDLRYDSQRKRVCFPIRDFDGTLRGFHGRSIEPGTDMPYFAYGYRNKRNPMVWLGEDWVDFDKPVLIVESVFDLASCLRVYSNVVCPLSAGIGKRKCERMLDANVVYTLMDYGTGGNTAKAALDRWLQGVFVSHIDMAEEDHDPGECSVETLTNYLGGILPLDKP